MYKKQRCWLCWLSTREVFSKRGENLLLGTFLPPHKRQKPFQKELFNFFGLKEVSSSLPGSQWERIAVMKISPQNIYYTLYAQTKRLKRPFFCGFLPTHNRCRTYASLFLLSFLWDLLCRKDLSLTPPPFFERHFEKREAHVVRPFWQAGGIFLQQIKYRPFPPSLFFLSLSPTLFSAVDVRTLSCTYTYYYTTRRTLSPCGVIFVRDIFFSFSLPLFPLFLASHLLLLGQNNKVGGFFLVCSNDVSIGKSGALIMVTELLLRFKGGTNYVCTFRGTKKALGQH